MRARPSMEKRRKEMQRQERKQRKAERREQRKAERADRTDSASGEDPDLAGIVAGPQPLPPEFGVDDEPPTDTAAAQESSADAKADGR